ncbi:MAG: hypothetical protein KDD83_19460 [Caldilineaceae bacterium]|nr:hypothetical protein [Caldilineaceae bacterium]
MADITTYRDPVATLLTLGAARPAWRDWRDYRADGLSEDDVPELIRMIHDETLNGAKDADTTAWAPVHAWRALGQLRAPDAVTPLVDCLVAADEQDDDWALDEIPTVLGMIGPDALPALRTLLHNGDNSNGVKNAGVLAVLAVAEEHPTAHDGCVDLLGALLAQSADNTRWTNGVLIGALIELHALDRAPLMEQAFAQDRVDLSVNGDWQEVQIELGLLNARAGTAQRWVENASRA